MGKEHENEDKEVHSDDNEDEETQTRYTENEKVKYNSNSVFYSNIYWKYTDYNPSRVYQTC